MSAHLGQPGWITDPATVAVLDALEVAGGASCVRFVGGCVRNSLMRQPVDDIDLATTLTPDQVINALAAAGLRAVPTGIDHGTVTAISQSRPFEITTLRQDVDTDGRHAVVRFSTDWAPDAARRDFCLNALYADRSGAVFDPTGRGVEDAMAGRIRFVGDPAQRIAEDYLRILRFFRFTAWYGRGEADSAALAACEAARDGLASLSAERVQKELLKLLAAYDPVASLRLMASSGVLTVLLPQCPGLERLERLVGIETEQLFSCDAELRLAALLSPDTSIPALAERLRLSNAVRDRLTAATTPTVRIVSWMSPRETRRAIYRLGPKAFSDQILLAWANDRKSATTQQWRGLLALATSWTPPVLPLKGEEIIAAGVPRGPMVKAVQAEVEAWWIDQDFPDDKFSLIECLKSVAQGLAW